MPGQTWRDNGHKALCPLSSAFSSVTQRLSSQSFQPGHLTQDGQKICASSLRVLHAQPPASAASFAFRVRGATHAPARACTGPRAAVGTETASVARGVRESQARMSRSPPEILPTESIEAVLDLPAVNSATLVCLDLDDVLLKTTQYTGSEAWESALVAELQRNGFPESQARGIAGQLWRALHWVCESDAPEGATTTRVVSLLQSRAAAVIGLTARDSVLMPLTARQLAHADISFGSDKTVTELVKGARCSGGVIYCGGASKREALLSYMRKRASSLPLAQLTTVVHVDDRISHLYDLASAFGGEGHDELQDAEDAVLTSSLSFVGVHYTRVATDRDRAGQHDGEPTNALLDPGTVALALALTSEEARLHLHNAVQCASGDERFFYAKH